MEKVTITDLTNFNPQLSQDGGQYSFTTYFEKTENNKYKVTYGTSAQFDYCIFCGTFSNNDSCESYINNKALLWNSIDLILKDGVTRGAGACAARTTP